MCLTCDGFDSTLHSTDSCRCECVDDGGGDAVQCSAVESCPAVESSSTLEGVEIQIVDGRCSWTRAELEAGVTFEYEVVVDQSAPTLVNPSPQDAGGCGRPDDSGLIVFYEIVGQGEDRYCLCDTGFCQAFEESSDLNDGVHAGSFEWTGHRWSGPSDTGIPVSDVQFQPGPATVRVRAIGTDADGNAFEVLAEQQIEIL